MTISVYALSNRLDKLTEQMPEGIPYKSLKLDREARAELKSAQSLMLFLDLLDGTSVRDVQKLIKSIPMNASFYLVLLCEDESLSLGHIQADESLNSYEALLPNHPRLVNLYRLLCKKEQQAHQMQAQTNLLLSINHFAQFRIPWQTLLSDFAMSLSSFCGAASTFLYDNKQKKLSQVFAEGDGGEKEISQNLLDELALSVKPLTELSQPNVNLIIEQSIEQRLHQEANVEVEAVLSFPLVVYEQNFQTIICLIDKTQMSKVSVQQIDIMKEAAIQLKILIERRVAENKLKSQFQRLKNTLQELQSTKEQLVHSEKMAAVGKLAAGIAHEINNPLSYVLGNLEPLDEYVKTITKLLTMHDELIGNLGESLSEDSTHLMLRIEQEQEQEDLDFVLEDIKAIVDNSKDGLLRVKDIINDLSSFSRQQPLELQTFRISELLSETIRLMKYEVSEEIELKLMNEDGMEIEAQRGFTLQILTNLVKNAIHAIQDAAVDSGKVVLSYFSDQGQIKIKVEDNGPGIPEDIQQSIFTPFFTTKGVGKGTGLGLSVSYNLAKKMNGSLALDSEPGRTAFTLSLPQTGENE